MKDIEIGPIRPPSESESLLIRVTRGCHWNKCYFCGLYKSMKFSMRPIEETIADIEKQATLYQRKKIKSCFLQDGDALVLKTDYLLRILEALNKCFPDLEYITSYARADSITRKSPVELKELRQAGLNHLYCGMETGSDMEGIMSKLGLSGRAFIPMILGFGCTVPAIMASRALENRRDRFKVMLITPFMSCSARLPIYILFAEMFFADKAMLVAYSMYLIGLIVAILVAAVIHLIDRKKSENYLLIELPEYKAPSSRTVAIYVWEKIKDYLTKAGTTIFVASIAM